MGDEYLSVEHLLLAFFKEKSGRMSENTEEA